jgi:phosphoglycolate phosphatase-like HAD superfamily hydrolase
VAVEIGRVRALCFDVDGTLRNTDDQLVQRLARFLRPVRFSLPGRDPLLYARRLVMAIEYPGNYVFGLTDRLNIDQHITRIMDRLPRSGSGQQATPALLIQGVKETLARLKPRYPMAVVSIRGEKTTNAFLRQHELSGFFQAVATGQTCRHTKPYPDPLLWAARQMGVPPSACLMVGDTTVDIRTGRAAGAQTAGVLCGFGEEEELRMAGADVILTSTADLADFLLGKNI